MARPIDKELKSVNQTATTSVTTSTLKTTTFPGTVVGLRWVVSAVINVATGNPLFHWAIVVIPDGEAANTPSGSDGADFYTPEQNVLAFGISYVRDSDVAAGPGIMSIEGSTKTMRKLKQGDVLAFITICDTATGVLVDGVIQFFFKT